jgi:phosphoribosylanthranilate isomerase
MSGRRVRVKICGLTNRLDALTAIALGADALGFNLHPGSKRAIVLDEEAKWITALPPFVTRVAVLVNVPLAEARRVAAHPAVHMVQFHGDEDADYCARFAAESGRPFIKALRLRDAATIESAGRFSTSHLLLDADAGAAYGGAGQLIDLDLAGQFRSRHPALTTILAGGLRPENVAWAIGAVRPFAVDVASGVEVVGDPRRKDGERMAAFLEESRRDLLTQ